MRDTLQHKTREITQNEKPLDWRRYKHKTRKIGCSVMSWSEKEPEAYIRRTSRIFLAKLAQSANIAGFIDGAHT